jgi:hypothetical protein
MTDRLLAPDLYAYLSSLAGQLDRVGATVVAQDVRHAAKFASGSTSEFYGEARLLLPKVLEKVGTRLPDLERARLIAILESIESELRRIGGA